MTAVPDRRSATPSPSPRYQTTWRTSLALLMCLLLFSACRPAPTPANVKAIKKQFLALRVSAPFDPKFRGLGDRSLFQLACKRERVSCAEVLKMLKKSDPKFYQTLTKSKK